MTGMITSVFFKDVQEQRGVARDMSIFSQSLSISSKNRLSEKRYAEQRREITTWNNANVNKRRRKGLSLRQWVSTKYAFTTVHFEIVGEVSF